MPPTPPPVPHPAAAGGAMGWVKTHQPAAAAIGAAGVGGIALLMRKRKATTTTPSGYATVAPVSTADTTGTDLYNSLQPEIDSLSSQIQALANSGPATAAPPGSTSTTSTGSSTGTGAGSTAPPVTTPPTSPPPSSPTPTTPPLPAGALPPPVPSTSAAQAAAVAQFINQNEMGQPTTLDPSFLATPQGQLAVQAYADQIASLGAEFGSGLNAATVAADPSKYPGAI